MQLIPYRGDLILNISYILLYRADCGLQSEFPPKVVFNKAQQVYIASVKIYSFTGETKQNQNYCSQ